jgi:outer membrane protein assembly factor BamB
VWSAKLGNQTYGNPTVGGGKVFVGTNNASPRDRRIKGDKGILLCFDDATGKFLWQLVVPKIPEEGNFNGDCKDIGITSSPTLDGDRVYLCTNRCEVVCLSVDGLAKENRGPYKDEGQHMAGPGQPPREPGPQDADILWLYDLRKELGVWPQDATNCSTLILGDYLYVCTSNGVDKTHVRIPSPDAPSFIVLDKNTGQLIARDQTPNGPRFFHGNWSNPSYAKVGDQGLIFWGGGDGFCYALDPEPLPPGDDGKRYLRTVWMFNCNPPERKKFKYKHAEGPSEVLSTPVCWNNKVYVDVGQDPLHGNGIGTLSCINAFGSGDISDSGKVWQYDKGFHRSLSTVSIYNGLLFVADFWGFVHCLDPDTGRPWWVHDLKTRIWGSCFSADGKVYLGTESKKLVVFEASKECRILGETYLGAKMYTTPIAVNGRLYVASQERLFVVEKARK